MLLLALMTMSALYAVSIPVDGETLRQRKELRTQHALAHAKQALIAWSVHRAELAGGNPGELPCPDTDVPGASGYGKEEGACGAGKLGRLPWKTLGIAPLLDGDGEPLWYAIDGNFRKSNPLINSDNRATLRVLAIDGQSSLAPPGDEAAAIIFSPGAALAGQTRDTPAAAGNPANYLEAALGIDNAGNGGPYLQGPVRTATGTILVNDRIAILRADELMAAVEIRVMATVDAMLTSYAAANGGYYPYPAKADAPACLDTRITSYCRSDPGVCRGRLPQDAAVAALGLGDWPTLAHNPAMPAMPLWFSRNLWGQLLFYSVDWRSLKTATGLACAPRVDGAARRFVVFFPGSPRGTVDRRATGQSTALADYLEDPANRDGWSQNADDNYITPGVGSNDRLLAAP